jgi:hypothetical protein
MHRPRRRSVALLVSLVSLTAGCGDDDDDADAAIDAAIDAAAAEASQDGEIVEVVAVDYRFDALPERIEAGAQLALRNDSDAEAHELVAFALPTAEERTAAELFALPQDELDEFFANYPDLVLVAEPGAEAFVARGDRTLPQRARYLLFCGIPTGADPAEYVRQVRASQGRPDVAGGAPHYSAGMFGEITVE